MNPLSDRDSSNKEMTARTANFSSMIADLLASGIRTDWDKFATVSHPTVQAIRQFADYLETFAHNQANA